MTIYERKKQYFRNYCKEMNPFRKNELSDTFIEKLADGYINSEDSKWINLFYKNDLAGFLIIGKHNVEKHPDTDYSIAHCYVSPAYRHKGIMRKAAGEYLENHPGKWSALTYRNDEYGAEFYNRLFEECGFKPLSLKRLYGLSDNILLHGWES